MESTIELDDDALARAAGELGTTTRRDTVDAALRLAAERHERMLDDPAALGGSDTGDAEVMRQARR